MNIELVGKKTADFTHLITGVRDVLNYIFEVYVLGACIHAHMYFQKSIFIYVFYQEMASIVPYRAL